MSRAKPSATESARLDDIARYWIAKGYSSVQIAEACGFTSPSAINKRLGRLGIKPQRGGYRHPLPPIPVQMWLDTQQPPPSLHAPSYRESTTVQLIRAWLTTLTADNAVNRLAHDSADAIEAHDERWIQETRQLLLAAHTYLYRLTGVVDDSQLRHQAMVDPLERDDMPRALRLIKRSS